jgi:uncharacterized membrane protein
LPADSLARIGALVSASEQLQRGKSVFVETHLPHSYLWRFVRQGTPVQRLIRQRAIMLIAKLCAWDTASNNGVLMYALLVEGSIEVVADRGFLKNECSALASRGPMHAGGVCSGAV